MSSIETDRGAARLPSSLSKRRRKGLSSSPRENRRRVKHGDQNRSNRLQRRKLMNRHPGKLRKRNNRNNQKPRVWSTKRKLRARRRKLLKRRPQLLQQKS